MTNRVNPTEKAIKGMALKLCARLARTRCGVSPVKTVSKPVSGNPGGPGMKGVLDLERAHASPPGANQKAKMAMKSMKQRRAS